MHINFLLHQRLTNVFEYITFKDVYTFKAEMNKSFPVDSLCILQIALCVSVHTSEVHYVQPPHSSLRTTNNFRFVQHSQ